MTILCGTDLSKGAEPALAATIALAKRTREDEVVLAHALDDAAPLLDSEPGGSLHLKAVQRLELDVQRVRLALPHALVHGSVVRGPAPRALADLAEHVRARLLVVTSHGHGASMLLRLGGTTERLAQVTRTPLLVVRDARPFEAWARGEDRPLTTLLALDRSASSEPVVRWAHGLRGALTRVVVGHVYDPATERERYGLGPAPAAFEADPEVERLLVRDLATIAGDLGPEVRIRPVVGVGRSGDHLLRLAASEDADLIVVGTHHRHGLARLSSVASVVLHHATASVLIVPHGDEELLGPPPEPGTIERVLIATDLSAFSDHVIPLGFSLPSAGGEVHLLHVVRPGDPRAVDDARRMLDQRIPAAVRRAGAPRTVAEVVCHDDPAQAIVETAERIGADLVCLATHGRTWLMAALLGSVTRDVLRRCRRPVVVMHPPRR